VFFEIDGQPVPGWMIWAFLHLPTWMFRPMWHLVGVADYVTGQNDAEDPDVRAA
jgi:hypothetical protein